MLQGKHSAILSTFIKVPFVIKIIVLSIFEWPFYTGLTVHSYVIICGLFSKLPLLKDSFRNTIRMSKGLYPYQDWHSVNPDLGPNCLQMLFADNKSCH